MTPFLLPSDVLSHLLRRLKRYKFHGLKDFRPYERLGQHRRGKRVQNALYLPTIKRHSIFEFIVAGSAKRIKFAINSLTNISMRACPLFEPGASSQASDILNYLINHRRCPIHCFSRASTPFIQIYRQIHERSACGYPRSSFVILLGLVSYADPLKRTRSHVSHVTGRCTAETRGSDAARPFACA